MRARAAVLLLSLAACTHAPPSFVTATEPGARSAHAPARSDGGVARVPTVDAGCPLTAPGTDAVLATVGDATITGCDVYVEWHRRTRLGWRVDDAAAILRELVDRALLASRHEGALPPEAQRELAEALLRHEALAAMEPVSESALRRWMDRHDEPETAPRARARHLVFATRPAALAALRRLHEGGSFDEALASSIDPLRERDQGDLGYVSTGRSDLPAELVRAVFAVREVGAWADEPVRVTQTVTVQVRRRQRERRVVGWHLVQLLDLAPSRVLSREELRRRALHRLSRERYESALDAARARWAERLRGELRGAVDARALGTVRVRPAGQR